MATKMVGWNVYLKGKRIDKVFFEPTCNKDSVYKSLVEHDGYDPAIIVNKEQR